LTLASAAAGYPQARQDAITGTSAAHLEIFPSPDRCETEKVRFHFAI
jgi:hypothetical protein